MKYILTLTLMLSMQAFADTQEEVNAGYNDLLDGCTGDSEAVMNSAQQQCAQARCINNKLYIGENEIAATCPGTAENRNPNGSYRNTAVLQPACLRYVEGRINTEGNACTDIIGDELAMSGEFPEIEETVRAGQFTGSDAVRRTLAQQTQNCVEKIANTSKEDFDSHASRTFELPNSNGKQVFHFQGCDEVLGGNGRGSSRSFMNQNLAREIEKDTVKDKICLSHANATTACYELAVEIIEKCNPQNAPVGTASGQAADVAGAVASPSGPSECDVAKQNYAQCDTSNMPELVSSCFIIKRVRDKIAEDTNGESVYMTTDAQETPAGPNGEVSTSFGRGGFACRNNQQLALDYKSCRRSAYAHNLGFVGDLVSETGIEVYGQIRNVDIQADQQQASASIDPADSQTAALEAVRRRHELAATQQRVRMAVQGTKGATMLGFMFTYVTPKRVANKWCDENSPDDYNLTGNEACMVYAMAKDSSTSSSSGNNIDGTPLQNIMFPNQGVRGNLGMGAAESLTKAIAAGLIAKLKSDQAKRVGAVQEEFEAADFNNESGFDPSGLPTFCSENPTAPSCAGARDNGRRQGGGVDFSFGNGIGGAPTNLDLNGEVEDENGAIAGRDTSLTPEQIDDLSSIVDGEKVAKGGGDFSAPSAGSISTSARQGGGGGGGGASASAPGGAGGGPGGEAAKEGGLNSALGKADKSRRVAGGGGRVAGGGGRATKNTKNTNPFANLVGTKRSNRAIASREPKSLLPKNIRLFTAISKRYSEVSRSGRLEDVKSEEEKIK